MLRRRRQRRIRGRQRDTELAASVQSATASVPLSELSGFTQPIRAYSAIIVNAVSVEDLEGGIRVQDLPTQIIQLPWIDVSEIAILSWRWDFDEERRSRNLTAAVKYAQSVGIRYMFADVVSIDQSLNPTEIIQHVVAFSILFETVPVIAAYDHRPRLIFSKHCAQTVDL